MTKKYYFTTAGHNENIVDLSQEVIKCKFVQQLTDVTKSQEEILKSHSTETLGFAFELNCAIYLLFYPRFNYFVKY